ncbi:MAG TPA: MFS transporter [Acidobacteriaceae bacterium]|nr:MFS transporter [Acidobacteriaceae bacterium]
MTDIPTPPETLNRQRSAWQPLRRIYFRNLWIASLVSNLGGWMQDTAGTWLMTVLTGSPLLIALMQTAASMPVLLLGFIAGASADIFERRRLLIFWQSWMLVSVLLLSIFTLTGFIGPITLLVLTFLLNIGVAINNPAWQSIVPELVPRPELPDAISINSVGFNMAHAVGPALGGLAMVAFASTLKGAGAVFLLNSASFVAVIAVLFTWKRTPTFHSALPAELMLGSMRAGLRYIRHAPLLQATLVRAFLFTSFVSAIWALLAVVAHRDLHQGALGYSLLNGCLGVGAVGGAAYLPKLRQKFSSDQIVSYTPLVCIATLVILAFVRNMPLIVVALIAAGSAWTTTTSTFNISVQLSVPPWVQARALGVYQMIFWGGMALGSALWGYIAEHTSTSKSLILAAIGLLCSMPLAHRFHLLRGDPPDMNPYALNRPAPQVLIEPHPEDGPVMVTIEYQIRAGDYVEFTHSIHKLRNVRLRDGAVRWGVFQDAGNPSRFVETFIVESWIEFLRERERMTVADRTIRDHVWSMHHGDAGPLISYMLYARESPR